MAGAEREGAAPRDGQRARSKRRRGRRRPNGEPGSGRAGGTLEGLLAELDAHFLERRAVVRLILLACFARVHVLLLGPPGTAKSMLAATVAKAFETTLFSTLMTKFSAPEDVLGPLSLPELEAGNYVRLTAGYLPTAQIAFIDEIYKSNASILNALLSILNERCFYNGSRREGTPLRTLIAASNEVPDEEDGLDALDDRLLLRIAVSPIVSDSSFIALLQRPTRLDRRIPENRLPVGLLREVEERAATIGLGEEVVQLLCALRAEVREQGLGVSDRRWRQSAMVMATMAAMEGAPEVTITHAGVLRYILWRRPEQRELVQECLQRALGQCRVGGATATLGETRQLVDELLKRLDLLIHNSNQDFHYSQRNESLCRELEHKAREIVRAMRQTSEVWRVRLSDAGLWGCFWEAMRVPLAEELKRFEEASQWARLAQLRVTAVDRGRVFGGGR